MESGERLASPSSAPSSLHMASSSTSSSPGPAPAQPQSPSAKCSPVPSPAAGSPLTTCGHLFRTAGDSHFNMSGISGAFPLVSHPAFGLYTTSSGRSEFGGLGTLGVSAALAAHSQLGTFPDWWRASEAHSRGAAAFFPPLLGLPPIFAAPFQSHDPANFQSRTPSKNGRAAAKGVNGSMNGGSTSSISAGNPLPFLAKGTMEKTKTANGSGRSHKSSQDVVQMQQKSTKEKKLNKKALETSSMSGSQSGSSSDSSSGGECSSDLDDLDEDDDDEDQSNDSEDSDSEKESRVKRKLKDLTQNPAESKKKRTSIAEGSETRESLSITSQKRCDDAPPSSSYLPLPSHHNALLRATAALFQSSKPREEEGQQHASVIQATGLVAGSKPLAMVAQSHHRDVSPLPHRSSPKPFSSLSSSSSSPMHFSSSPKHFPLTASPKHFPHSPSPKHNSFSSSPKPLSLCSSPKPLSLCSSPKPLSLSSSPKPPSLSSSPKPPTLSPSHKPQSLTVSPKHTRIMDGLKAGSRNFLDEGSLHTNSLKLKQPFLPQDSFKQTFPLPLKNQDMYKSHKKVASSTLPPPKLSPEMLGCRILPPPHGNHTNILPPPHGNHTNLFLNHHPNGVIHGPVQDAPLALLSKPRSQSSKPLLAATSPAVPMPVNLSSDSKEPSATVVGSFKASTSSGQTHRPRKNKAPKPLHVGKSLSKTAPQPLVELLKGTESDIPSSKDSDDSLGDDDDDDDDDEDDDDDVDSDGSLSESESNPESDSDGSEEDVKERDETDTDAERTPQKLCKTSLHSSSSSLSTSCSPLNLQVIKPPSLPCGLSVPGTVTFYDTGPSSSPSLLATSPGSGKRRRVTDERVLRLPLDFGWQRETRIRTVGGRLQGEVAYYAPCGKKLRQYPDVMKYLSRNGITEISRDNFSFSTKIKVGDFYEAREGHQGLQWCLLTEEEIVPSIIAMDGRRSRHNKSENQQAVDGAGARSKKGHPPNVADIHLHDANEAKLLRKLEAQEIARQAAQIKMMRKLEKQAMARAAKEARRQQAIMAAEERRKKKEQMKIFKQQEKIKRIQQIRMEKELRAQQILEAKRKKKEEAANAKILEAEKRSKEKEMRRQHAVVLKHQELERHRLDMERERRRQHMMLMKAMEARKKAEERERLKQEKKDEKRLNKERKLELRRLELEIAKELKKPNEDMCLADHKPLPELARIPGLVLPGAAFSDCLTVMQFLRSFGKVLRFDVSAHVPNLSVLQEGLLNIGDCMGQVQDLLVRMLSEAVCDPGLPPGHRTKTALGDHLTNVGITRENVSEILQIYMEAHCVHTELAELALSLKTKAFQAHTPSQKASMLAFLVNELCCSKAVVSEIDKNIDHMTNLRKDKWFIEGKLRKLRSVYAKKTGKRDSSGGGEDSQALGTPTAGRKRKRKDVDSEEDEDEDEDSEDEDDDEDEEEAGGKRGKKADACEEEDDSDQTASVEELEKQIEKSSKQQSQIRRKLFESSQLLRSMVCGQDRYKRRYWVLPQCGGVFVEGMESGEAPDEMEKEREKQMRIRGIKVKEEQLEEEEKPVVPLAVQSASTTGQRDCLNLFLQKPGSFSKLSKLLEVAKMSPELDGICHTNQSGYAPKIHASALPPPVPASETMRPCNPPPTAAASSSSSQLGPSLLSSSYLNASPEMTCSSQPPLPNDQLFRVLTEKSGHWFSLLPRSPCDESSVTSSPTPLAPSSPPPQATYSSRPISPSSVSPNPLVTASSGNPAGINNLPLSTVQQVKCSAHQTGLPFCGWPSGVASANLTFPGSPLSPMLALAYQHTEGNGSASGNQFLAPTISTSKSETPEPPSDKPSSAPSPAAVEAAKNQDYTSPQPIPEEMLCGWWKLSEMEELQALVKALHSRGIREKALQKQIQKHMEYMAQACAKNKEVAVIDARRLEEQQVSEETVESWCVEEQAMEVDIGLLQQVEELERRVTSASLQVKGWMHPEPQSEREDLVYHEHKPFSSLDALSEGDRGASQEERPGGVARRPNNPLDIAVTRLSELERNIERRYLKSPLSTTIQIRLDHVGTVTVPAPATACSGDGEGGDEELAPGMRLWRKALAEVRSAAQLSLCVHLLQKSIAWERSIMKVYCQLCQKGDNEELLLLCDGCDRGCHTYCHKPKITTIPEGDWFCPACIAKASDQSPRSKKQLSGAAGGARKGSEVKRNRKPPVVGELCEEEAASPSSSCSSGGGVGGSTPKKGSKESKKMDTEESPSTNPPKQNSPVPCAKKAKTAKDNNAKDLAMCRVLLAELEGHQDAWPFLTPVNPKAVPGYKKIIKKPMDFSTIREKLVNSQYLNLETFIIDVNLVFDNCEKFNEDNSDIGRAGHSMRKFFEKRWTELLKQTF